MAVFVTSDLHYGHDRSFIWSARGYNSVEEMNEEQVRKWNEIVSDEDDVYVLGDLMLGDVSNIEYLKRLNGRIHVVFGNHDSATRQKMYAELPNVVECAWAIMLNYRKYHFYMTHFPCMTGNNDDDKPPKARTWNLCGHSHVNDFLFEIKQGHPCYHVEVDAHNGYPILLDKIIEDIQLFWTTMAK